MNNYRDYEEELMKRTHPLISRLIISPTESSNTLIIETPMGERIVELSTGFFSARDRCLVNVLNEIKDIVNESKDYLLNEWTKTINKEI